MRSKTVIYGDIVNKAERQRLEKEKPSAAELFCWQNKVELVSAEIGASSVFVDLDDPRFSTSDFLISVATAGEKVQVIGKSDKPSVEEALRVSKLGVSEILTPDQCLERLRSLLTEVEKLPVTASRAGTNPGVQSIVGISPQIREIRNTIDLLADVDFPSALILGGTGTGKSLICKILHNAGIRSEHNLVEVNCSAIPDDLFESELFGHVKGAFTDAKSDKTGLFEYAENGTLFLDEVGNLSQSAQAKLLKILEDKRMRKVGSIEETNVNVRVVAATNLDLEKAIQQGTFREDLFFRLNLLTIEIPPLCERIKDVEPLVEYYLGYYATNYGKPGITIDPGAIEEMKNYNWPGNVRQLCNVIERAVLLSKSGRIKASDIKEVLQKGRVSLLDRQRIIIDVPPQGITLRKIEEEAVKQVLNSFNWNKSETAKYLGISRPRLRRIIEAAGLERNRRS